MLVEVELQRVPEGERGYQTAATLAVYDDQTYKLDDPEGLFPLDVPVPVSAGHSGTQLRRLMFDEDPETWARNLGRLLRTGYLVPVIRDGRVTG